jgi:hypothetical protein
VIQEPWRCALSEVVNNWCQYSITLEVMEY